MSNLKIVQNGRYVRLDGVFSVFRDEKRYFFIERDGISIGHIGL
jgi:hypothetical protein